MLKLSFIDDYEVDDSNLNNVIVALKRYKRDDNISQAILTLK